MKYVKACGVTEAPRRERQERIVFVCLSGLKMESDGKTLRSGLIHAADVT